MWEPRRHRAGYGDTWRVMAWEARQGTRLCRSERSVPLAVAWLSTKMVLLRERFFHMKYSR